MKLTPADRDRLAGAVALAQRASQRQTTPWWLLTGAPGSGKTTLARYFASRGWRWIEDPGRAEFEAQRALGIAPESVRLDYLDFQRRVLRRELAAVAALPTGEPAVFDYGIAEALAFLRVSGIPWDDDIVNAAARFQFSKVFLLDLVPLDSRSVDSIRAESLATRQALQGLIQELYEALGHTPVRVPLMPTEMRFAWIESHA